MGTQTFDLYLDDSGSRWPDKGSLPERHDEMDHFAIGGFLIKSEDHSGLVRKVDTFRNRHGIDHPLHSSRIRSRKEGFQWLGVELERAKVFYEELGELLCSLPIFCIACCIDRPGYNARYKEKYKDERWKLCKSAYTIVVERAAKFSKLNDRKLIVYVEQTGKREDREIREYHRAIRENGMYFNSETSQKYSPLPSNQFTEILIKNPTFIRKENIAAQVADLVLYPIIKSAYDGKYPPYLKMKERNILIDSVIEPTLRDELGIKYYCFEKIFSK